MMRELPTVLLFAAFITMCILMFFLKGSKTYDDAAHLPLDEEVKDKLRKQQTKEESK